MKMMDTDHETEANEDQHGGRTGAVVVHRDENGDAIGTVGGD